jgi:uncharacterized protein (DUF952 family)
VSRHVFHIAERAAFSLALETGAYECESLGREGFIHCSTRQQVMRTANRFYAGRSGLVLLCIDAERVQGTLRDEPADGELFPHHYGPIPLEAILLRLEFSCTADGLFTEPEELAIIAE